MSAPRVKICGLRRQEDLDCAAEAGAEFCGFIFHPASPRSISPQAAARLDSRGLRRVGVFVRQTEEEIREILRVARLDLVQLHGDQSPDCARALGAERVIRVLWPARYPDRAALEAAMALHAPSTALFLLDAGMGGGGSGQRLLTPFLGDLESPRPWLLAGGLTPDNARQALNACPGACGADLNSGLESAPGRKDHHKIRAALAALRGHHHGQGM